MSDDLPEGQMLSALHHRVLAKALATTLVGAWYRAFDRGEAVSLASLHRQGLLERRARRGQEGTADAAHEYRCASVVVEAWKVRGTRDK